MAMLNTQAKRIGNTATAEKRDLTRAEQEKIDKVYDEFSQLDSELAKVNLEIDDLSHDETRRPMPRVAAPMPIGGGDPAYFGATSSPARPLSAKFFDVFPQARAAGNGAPFNDLATFAKAVVTRDPRLFQNAAGAMQTSVGADGGFAIPSYVLQTIFDEALSTEVVRPRAFVVRMDGGDVRVPYFNTNTRTTSTGGLEPEVKAENASATAQKPVLGEMNLKAKTLVTYVQASIELIDDAPETFARTLLNLMSASLSQKLDDMAINGLGTGGQFQGILASPALITVAKETSEVAATIVPANLRKMKARLYNPRGRAVWLISPSAEDALWGLQQTVMDGTSVVGGYQPGWFTSTGPGAGMLMGLPWVANYQGAQLGTVGDVILADLSQYIFGLRSDASLAYDAGAGFASYSGAWRLTMRADAQGAWSAPITLRRQSDTVSPFVCLATRS